MNSGTMNVKITINAQVGDGNTYQVGHTDVPMPVTIGPDGKASFDLETVIREALCNCTPTECSNHRPVQHRDGKPPWCNACRKG